MLSNRLRWMRKEKGYTQKELALQLHVSASAVGMYEQGRRNPSADVRQQMEKLLEVPEGYLTAQDQNEDWEKLFSEIKVMMRG